jgi:hypothetical protein
MAPTVTAPAAPFDAQTFFGVTPAVGASGTQSPIVSALSLVRTDVSLSSTNILNLTTIPITLAAAPGPGLFICPWLIVMRYTGGTVAYTDAGGAVSIGAGTLTVALSANTIFLTTVAPNTKKEILLPYSAAAGVGVFDTAANPPTEDNAALAISKVTNNFAAGNGTMRITTYYSIESTL